MQKIYYLINHLKLKLRNTVHLKPNTIITLFVIIKSFEWFKNLNIWLINAENVLYVFIYLSLLCLNTLIFQKSG